MPFQGEELHLNSHFHSPPPPLVITRVGYSKLISGGFSLQDINTVELTRLEAGLEPGIKGMSQRSRENQASLNHKGQGKGGEREKE